MPSTFYFYLKFTRRWIDFYSKSGIMVCIKNILYKVNEMSQNENYIIKRPVGRPKKEIKTVRVNITLHPDAAKALKTIQSGQRSKIVSMLLLNFCELEKAS